ncbi:MAG: hypothetical protein KBG00_14195 [Rhodoferax sp.]|nr:hypothetical protein [Rhodoferax sp.]MBP9149922.1 hypothetical protein [Rhodoferax sp.]MBP9737188.1 hypothetical protein [Rhodoferax sp.]
MVDRRATAAGLLEVDWVVLPPAAAWDVEEVAVVDRHATVAGLPVVAAVV